MAVTDVSHDETRTNYKHNKNTYNVYWNNKNVQY